MQIAEGNDMQQTNTTAGLKKDLLKELMRELNKTVQHYYNNDVQTSLAALVEATFADLTNRISQNISVFDQTFSNIGGIEDQVSQLELNSGQSLMI